MRYVSEQTSYGQSAGISKIMVLKNKK